MNRILIISGPSGTGKGTLCDILREKHPEACMSVSYATRKPREGEIDGVHYNFVSVPEFEQMIAKEQLLEYVKINDGNYYGTGRPYVEKCLSEGKSVLLEIEEMGGKQALRFYPDAKRVFILPPSIRELIKRLVDRNTEDLPKIIARMQKVESELKAAKAYDAVIVNRDIAASAQELVDVYEGTYTENVQNRALIEALETEITDKDEWMRYLNDYYTRRNLK